MFRTTRYWPGVSKLVPAMRRHIQSTGLRGRLGSKAEANLDAGTPIANYPIVFRELFCLAAADLADDLKQPIERVGILYDEIIYMGQESGAAANGKKNQRTKSDVERDANDGSVISKGQLLFLVSRAGRRDVEHFHAVGFRFANVQQVLPQIASRLHVKPLNLNLSLNVMQEYATVPHILDPGVHLACFAVRASLAGHGFEILARKDAKNQLPTMQLPLYNLEEWHMDYLKQMDSFTVAAAVKFLFKTAKPSNPSKEREFAKDILTSLEALKDEISDPFFNDATLLATPVAAPCRGRSEESPPGNARLITFRFIMPLHSRAPGKKLTFSPLNFFRAEQHVYKNSPDHIAFARQTRREFATVLDIPEYVSEVSSQKHARRFGFHSRRYLVIKGDHSSEKNLVDPNLHENPLGGIMVSREVSVDVDVAAAGPESQKIPVMAKNMEMGQYPNVSTASGVTKEDAETPSFVDELISLTMAKRPHL